MPAAGGAGVPHGSDGHSDAARGAGEELSGGRGRLQENHREAGGACLTRDAARLEPTTSAYRWSAPSEQSPH